LQSHNFTKPRGLQNRTVEDPLGPVVECLRARPQSRLILLTVFANSGLWLSKSGRCVSGRKEKRPMFHHPCAAPPFAGGVDRFGHKRYLRPSLPFSGVRHLMGPRECSLPCSVPNQLLRVDRWALYLSPGGRILPFFPGRPSFGRFAGDSCRDGKPRPRQQATVNRGPSEHGDLGNVAPRAWENCGRWSLRVSVGHEVSPTFSTFFPVGKASIMKVPCAIHSTRFNDSLSREEIDVNLGDSQMSAAVRKAG
jgi:hypothetical protein